MEKNVVYTVRIPKSLKEAFLDCADKNDQNGSQEIRKFMRQYIAKNGQQELLK